MSTKYTGGFITKSPVAPTSSAASGIWTLDQQQQAQKAGTWPSPPIFIEDLFSTYLYTGNGTSQTITNGINLSGNGGLVWTKGRSNAYDNTLVDTVRGVSRSLVSNATSAEDNSPGSYVTAFNSNGFSVGSGTGSNGSGATYASWTFQEQPKFFDIVTWTSTNSSTQRTISHNLGSTPGCVIIKSINNNTNSYNEWYVAHRYDLTAQGYLNRTFPFASGVPIVTAWTDTTITFAANFNEGVGNSYIVYVFAHNAGGFPASGSGSTNGISCGSYTAAAAGSIIDLGYEPQWIMIKKFSDEESWYIYDAMRGVVTGGGNSQDMKLRANNAGAEGAVAAPIIAFTANGFQLESTDNEINGAGGTYIYIAIRRGPMKPPTVGTSVFDEDLAGNASAPSFTSAFPVDLGFIFRRAGGDSWYWVDRLRGGNSLNSNNNVAEAAFPTLGKFDYMNGYGSSTTLTNYTGWNFKRAPGFFDVVAYTGNSTGGRAVTHNLGSVPQLMIVKSRSVGGTFYDWAVYSVTTGPTHYMWLNSTNLANPNDEYWQDTTPTASVFTLGNGTRVNSSGQTYVAYLFATVAGVSKVGSYTGTAATQTVNCGFTAGARFVLIKRTNASGDWFVWDSVRGIIAGNDPYVELNTEDAEVTNVDWIDTSATGFEVSNTEASSININGSTYIFLAIA